MEIKFTKQAILDIKSIMKFISQDNADIAKNISSQIKENIELLEKFPRLGIWDAESKSYELVISKLPYIVSYEIKKEVLYILTIMHTSRVIF